MVEVWSKNRICLFNHSVSDSLVEAKAGEKDTLAKKDRVSWGVFEVLHNGPLGCPGFDGNREINCAWILDAAFREWMERLWRRITAHDEHFEEV
jgi:hypothetical protein